MDDAAVRAFIERARADVAKARQSLDEGQALDAIARVAVLGAELAIEFAAEDLEDSAPSA